MREEIMKIINDRTFGILLLAGLSGVVNYLYRNDKGEKWEWRIFFINTALAIFVGYGVSIIYPDTEKEKIVVMICAFTARDILYLMEKYIPKILKQKLDEKINNNKT